MPVWLLLVVLSTACDYNAAPTNSFTNVFALLHGKPGPSFVLCLDNSTAKRRFSLGSVPDLTIKHLTIQ